MNNFRSLIRVELPVGTDSTVFTTQKREPYWESPGNGYAYGPSGSSFSADALEVLQHDPSNNLRISHSSKIRRSAGGDGIVLGSAKNLVDICMYGVPDESEIFSKEFYASEIEAVQGVIEHQNGDTFDRRIILPIFAGKLSIHLSRDPLVRAKPASLSQLV